MSEQDRRSTPAYWWGKRIRSEREKRCMTQEQLAAAVVAASGDTVALSRSAVARWETGSNPPALRYRPHLAAVLGIPVEYLFGSTPAHEAAA